MPPVTAKKSATRPDDSLGEWRDGAFHFDSPEAERQWQIEAYRSGVHADGWHHGQVLDSKTRDVVLSGLGGPTPPYYRGPDGAYRFANRQTIEPADVRELRRQSLEKVKAQDIKGPEMPGEDVIAARFAAKQQRQSANDNALPPANDNPPPATEAAPKPGPMAMGRFAEMAAAQKSVPHPSLEETVQAIDDGVRLLANGATIGYADNVAAAADALFGSGSFAEDYEKNLAEQKAQTEAALGRSGIVGALIQAAPQFIPGAGDAIGLGSDIKMYLEDPSQRSWKNYGLTALGALPFVPSVASSIKRVDDAIETAAKVEAKVAGKAGDIPIQVIDPHETRFSQKTVSFQKSNRAGGKDYTFDDIQNSMQKEGWQKAPIDVVRMNDGQLTSLDNTRLLAARKAGIKAHARVHEFDEVMPKREASRIRGLTDENATWGQAVEKRVSNQKGQFSKVNPYGSLKDPKVTKRPPTEKKE